jgi:tRNA ligase
LITELTSASVKNKRLVRNTEFTIDEQGTCLLSWKCDEWSYKKDPCPLPTLARGLFSRLVDDRHVIAARGYDKFFNVDEVKQTRAWPLGTR